MAAWASQLAQVLRRDLQRLVGQPIEHRRRNGALPVAVEAERADVAQPRDGGEDVAGRRRLGRSPQPGKPGGRGAGLKLEKGVKRSPAFLAQPVGQRAMGEALGANPRLTHREFDHGRRRQQDAPVAELVERHRHQPVRLGRALGQRRRPGHERPEHGPVERHVAEGPHELGQVLAARRVAPSVGGEGLAFDAELLGVIAESVRNCPLSDELEEQGSGVAERPELAGA